MRTPDLKDRLSAASAAKKAQIERARAIAEDPERLKRIEARSEIIAARNIRIAERERNRREAKAREAAERAAAEAAEAAALEAARKAEEEERAGPPRRRRGGRTGGYSCSPQSGPEGEEAPARLAQFPLWLGRSPACALSRSSGPPFGPTLPAANGMRQAH
jgi:Family of unknown function (DUF6481)